MLEIKGLDKYGDSAPLNSVEDQVVNESCSN